MTAPKLPSFPVKILLVVWMAVVAYVAIWAPRFCAASPAGDPLPKALQEGLRLLLGCAGA